VPTNQNNQNRPSRKTGQIRGGAAEIIISKPLDQFNKRMRVYAYTATTVILVSLLIGVGWLYKFERVQSSDSILMFILAQVLGAWVGLTNKIFRIINGNQKEDSN
jgi:hypothetical protein